MGKIEVLSVLGPGPNGLVGGAWTKGLGMAESIDPIISYGSSHFFLFHYPWACKVMLLLTFQVFPLTILLKMIS